MTRLRHMPRRAGYTLLEMIVVLAVLIVIGSVVLPTIAGLTGNTRVLGAADGVKARLLEARLNAMDQGRPYLFSISEDGTKMRVSPDENVEGELTAEGVPIPGIVVDEDLPADVTLKQVQPGDLPPVGATADGYLILATFQPDGTCTADSPDIHVQENGVTGMIVRVRGLTGAVSLNKPTAGEVTP